MIPSAAPSASNYARDTIAVPAIIENLLPGMVFARRIREKKLCEATQKRALEPKKKGLLAALSAASETQYIRLVYCISRYNLVY
jgi:hypothetical protein